MAKRFEYSGDRLNEISFPLGGIGSGCIGLAGNGRLVDWEIFNRPSKGSIHGFSHFAVKAESEGRVQDVRALLGDLHAPYSGSLGATAFNSFGFGPQRETLAGVPHFERVAFTGKFPMATIRFSDRHFPGKVTMSAFNPFIPLNEDDSSLPAAFFEIAIHNNSHRRMDYSVFASLKNPFPPAEATNRFMSEDGISLVSLLSKGKAVDELSFGDMTVATDCPETSHQEYWYRGSWFDNLSVYWQDIRRPGRLANRRYESSETKDDVAYGKEDLCTLAAHFTLEPGARSSARFVVSWNFPNRSNYWNPEPPAKGCECEAGSCGPATWRNYYATLFRDSRASSTYCLRNWARLSTDTATFCEAFFSSSLPAAILEAVSANLSTLKSPTVMRLEDGTLYGFEGCHPSSGCCEGSCTHVWNYAYSVPFLFPRLERSMRDADFCFNRANDGSMSFRLQLPLGRERSRFRPCVDGQFGSVIKAFREWKISGDTDWLRAHWEALKSVISYAWSESNPDRWDRDKDGVLEGRQHHTLDMELFGPNSWLTGMYLAALRAMVLMAEHLGDSPAAFECRALFERGKAWVDENLFNGEYYRQLIELSDRGILETYASPVTAGEPGRGADVMNSYWSEEHAQIKYQIADGCAVDQVLAQWHANCIGLGEIFDRRKTRSALRAIHRHNYTPSMREHFNPCRIFALNDEAAVVICSFPGAKPAIPVPYAEEAMNGFEYQAASHMIQEGLLEEGLAIVEAIRKRYDGRKRNPWNEFECGSNYARSMASYALLLAWSGFSFDMVRGSLGFHPVRDGGRLSFFWSLEAGWGSFARKGRMEILSLTRGSLALSCFSTSLMKKKRVRDAQVGERRVSFVQEGGSLRFDSPITLAEGQALRIVY